MNKEQIKNELMNRFMYLNENSIYILAPYLKRRKLKGIKKLTSDCKDLIYLECLPNDLLEDLESFLLSDIPFNESKLYNDLELKKNDIDYLNSTIDGINLLKEKNKKKNQFTKTKLNDWELLLLIRNYIIESYSSENIEKRLKALDEYFRLSRCSNDDKVWTSGYSINFNDMNKISCFSTSLPFNETNNKKNDIPFENGDFINFIADTSNHYDNNFSVLTEDEKQSVYSIVRAKRF